MNFRKLCKSERYLTETQRRHKGFKIFKRKILGLKEYVPFCNQCSKSLDELAQILLETGLVSSLEEGIKAVPSLHDTKIPYVSEGDVCYKRVKLKKVTNNGGSEKYRIKFDAFTYAPDSC